MDLDIREERTLTIFNLFLNKTWNVTYSAMDISVFPRHGSGDWVGMKRTLVPTDSQGLAWVDQAHGPGLELGKLV